MLKRIAKYVGYAVLWCAMVAAVVWAESLSRKHDSTQVVCTTEIAISGGGMYPLIDNMAISDWLKRHNMHPEGQTLKSIDIAAIESMVESHSAVADANVSIAMDGSVEIDIVQREPVARLRVEEYDMYITTDGYLIPTTDGYAVRVPVVTGRYEPLFGSNFTGYVSEMARDSVAALESHIVALEQMKLPHYERLIENNAELRVVMRDRAKKGIFTSDEEYEILNNAYKERTSIAKARHNSNERAIRGDIAALEAEQEDTRHMQDEVCRQATEFANMVAMLTFIRDNTFWNAEVVQVEATGGGTEPLQLAIVPRSGRFMVDMGTTEGLQAKLETLYRFYQKALDRVGWDKYRSISLRYEGQVVCR